jgi:hypothetical protein
MTSSAAIIFLMSGAAFLAGCALYFYYRNFFIDYRNKLKSMNNALCALQGERATLINKNNDMYLENATQMRLIEDLKSENLYLKNTMDKLKVDNELYAEAYRSLENYVK